MRTQSCDFLIQKLCKKINSNTRMNILTNPLLKELDGLEALDTNYEFSMIENTGTVGLIDKKGQRRGKWGRT